MKLNLYPFLHWTKLKLVYCIGMRLNSQSVGMHKLNTGMHVMHTCADSDGMHTELAIYSALSELSLSV
jgi:hypothetical protein